MIILVIGDRVQFGDGHRLSGEIVGHGTMVSPGGSTLRTYAVRLDEQFQGYVGDEDHLNENFISTMLVWADGDKPERRGGYETTKHLETI